MKIREIMTKDVRTVSPETDLVTVARLMRDLNVGVVPVVQGSQILGLVTDRDLVIRVVAEGRSPQSEIASTCLTPSPITISADDDVQEAAKLMAHQQVRRLLVVDNGELVGIVSLGDVAVEGKDKLSGDVLEQISEPSQPRSRSLGQ